MPNGPASSSTITGSACGRRFGPRRARASGTQESRAAPPDPPDPTHPTSPMPPGCGGSAPRASWRDPACPRHLLVDHPVVDLEETCVHALFRRTLRLVSQPTTTHSPQRPYPDLPAWARIEGRVASPAPTRPTNHAYAPKEVFHDESGPRRPGHIR